jgi:hypothetical protein
MHQQYDFIIHYITLYIITFRDEKNVGKSKGDWTVAEKTGI